MSLLDPQTQEAVKNFFSRLKRPVRITLITSHRENLEANKIAKELLEELREISDNKLVFEINEKEGEDFYLKTPRFTFSERNNISFVGLPLGNEFQVFLEAIKIVSENRAELSLDVAKRISQVDRDLKLLVFTTPMCPHCIQASRDAVKFAFFNKNIKTYVTEITEFPDLAERFNIFAVPKIVILNGSNALLEQWEGAIPTKHFAERILNVIKNF